MDRIDQEDLIYISRKLSDPDLFNLYKNFKFHELLLIPHDFIIVQ